MTQPFRRQLDPATREPYLEVAVRGTTLTDQPILNKGTAFSQEERDLFGLRGLLPSRPATMEEQIQRVLANFQERTSDLDHYIHLISLLDRNETLFYRIVIDDIERMLPIIYTPTVGQACRQFGRIFRRHRGIYLTPEDRGSVESVLRNWPFDEVEIIVVTDGERVLGLGDLGAGGMGISIGKTSLYVAGAGFRPECVLPVCIDVGTDNESIRNDPLYLGLRRTRLRGPAYDDLLDAFVEGVARRFPRAIIQFEDFAKSNALRLLERYRDSARCFNDDIQGTGAVACAGIFAGLKIAGENLDRQRVFIVGGGSAGVGIAEMLSSASIWMFDSKGLITTDRSSASDSQRRFARNGPGGQLLDVMRRERPTILIGVSGQPGLFSREIIENLAGDRPLVFPLSNPTSKSECNPADVRTWTQGRALIASGSPFPNTAQCNNLYIFPGVGLGAIASHAKRVTSGMFRAAATALAELAPEGQLYPPLRAIRSISRAIAFRVGKEAIASGLAEPLSDDALEERISSEIWEPSYVPYRAALEDSPPANVARPTVTRR